MGGITGIFHRRGEPVTVGMLERPSRAIAHRGPVGEALWACGSVGLVHRRDNVLPPVTPGDQPLSDRTGRYRIVCNGRIYNAAEVAKLLADRDPFPPPESILEVMLRAYAAWGEKAFARFNGAYACAIWDGEERRLVLARDHFGVKPLFYRLTDDLLLFGSEVKSILADPRCPREPDETGIAEYLSANRFLLMTDRTFYRGVFRVLPAQVMIVGQQSARYDNYWRIDPSRAGTFPTGEDLVEETREILKDAVRIRLPENGRFGAALSGGFDSSSVVCLARHIDRTERGDGATLETFSYNFDTDEADETHLVDVVASHAGARHHAIHILTPEFFDDLDDVIRANDGPVVESSALILMKKKRRIREAGLDVQLSGLGGDELFQGQLNYFADLFRKGRWISLYGEIRGVYPVERISGKRTSLPRLARGFLLSPLLPRWTREIRKRYNGIPFPPDWMSPKLVARTGVGNSLPDPERPRFRDFYDQDCFDLFHYELVRAALHYHDCTSSAFAVDTRFPLIDVRLVESLFAVPREWKISRGRVRMLQKRAMAPFLPREILEDHLKKDHHPTVIRFMQSAFLDRMREFYSGTGQLSREYLDWDKLGRYFGPYLSGRPYNPLPLWYAISLERWLEMNFR